MIDSTYALSAIAVMAVVTFGLRALPFVTARWLQQSARVRALGRFLPLAVMVLLVLHTTLGQTQNNPAAPWLELLGVGLTAGLQWRWRHPLLSILAGTTLYVVLRQVLV
jgi:branched-subunit amino acid transport protein AzlD